MNDLFIPIRGFSKYSIHPAGIIQNNNTKKFLKPFLKKPQNYYHMSLYSDSEKKFVGQYIHRLIAQHFIPNPKNLECVDHVNGNPLDNSLRNLRWCSKAQNCQNRKKSSAANTSIYKGVYFDPIKNKYGTLITHHGFKKHLGFYTSEEDAFISYGITSILLFGEFHRLT
jgi:hypothetical protein